MDRRVSRAAGVVLATGSLALLAALSGWRYRVHADELSLLRVAFSARPERIERCREVSEEELARRLPHMRQRIECTGHSATYRLLVGLDGRIVTDQVIRGGGARQDRPVSLLVEHPVPPGLRRVMVRLERVEPADSSGPAPADSTRRARQLPLPPSLSVVDSIEFNAGRVVLVTYDSEARQLVLRTQSIAHPDRSRTPGRAGAP
jgi:hypothetical protein